MTSKIICNVLIVLFIIVCFVIGIYAVINKADWKTVVIPLILACGVLVMYQGVIYKGKKDKLINQIPWNKVTDIIKNGGKIQNAGTIITPSIKPIKV